MFVLQVRDNLWSQELILFVHHVGPVPEFRSSGCDSVCPLSHLTRHSAVSVLLSLGVTL